jgi:hypothetical protein
VPFGLLYCPLTLVFKDIKKYLNLFFFLF